MKYKIWQVADADYSSGKLKIVPLPEKIDKSDCMYITPDGMFIIRTQSEEYDNQFMIMSQASEFYELEILEID